MLIRLLLSTAIVFATGTAGFAQGFSGAELGLEYTVAPDDDDLGGVRYYGSAEFDVAYGVSLAFDASAYDFTVGLSDVSNITAHVIYNIDNATAAGLFFGRDSANDQDGNTFGVEVAYDFGLGTVDGYLGRYNDDDLDDVSIYGAAATYDLQNGFAIAANFDGLSVDDRSRSQFEVGGFYQLVQGPRFGATIGRANLDDGFADVSEMFFGVQASIAIGPNGGTTFGRRGIFEIFQANP